MTFQMGWEKATLNARSFFYLRRFLREADLSADQIRNIQLQRLKRLLVTAYENHEFYRERFHLSGFDPYRFSGMEQLEQIPILSKSEYRDFTTSVHVENPGAYESFYKDGTSGSTGTPLKIWRTWDERAYMIAKWMRVLYLNGYKWNDVTFSLPSPHRLQKDSYLQRAGVMKRHSIPYTAPVEKMVSEYIRVQPSVLYGNKSQLVEMAIYSEKNSVRLPSPRFYVCAAETLDEKSREIIIDAFGPNISEVYGAVEFNTLAWRAVGDPCFHVSHTTDVLELFKDKNMSGYEGHCVVTDLFINSFPLIRYQLGDYIEAENKDGLLVLNKIRGRLDDWIYFKDGTRKPFHPFYEIMERRPEVRQFRVIQESLDLVRVILVIDPSASVPDAESIILRDLKAEIRDIDIEYRIECVDEMVPDFNGKLRMLISKVRSDGFVAGSVSNIREDI